MEAVSPWSFYGVIGPPLLEKGLQQQVAMCTIWLRTVVGRTGPGRLYHEGLILFLASAFI